jgi:hypothetical protein
VLRTARRPSIRRRDGFGHRRARPRLRRGSRTRGRIGSNLGEVATRFSRLGGDDRTTGVVVRPVVDGQCTHPDSVVPDPPFVKGSGESDGIGFTDVSVPRDVVGGEDAILEDQRGEGGLFEDVATGRRIEAGVRSREPSHHPTTANAAFLECVDLLVR